MRASLTERGIALLEALLAALLAAPLMLMVGIGVQQASSCYLRARREYQNQYVYLKTTNLLQKFMHGLDSHPFAIPPRIHSGGGISLLNGDLNPAVFSPAGLPAENSDSISAIALEITATHSVLRAERRGWFVTFYACPRFGRKLAGGEFKTFAGVGPDGFVEFKGDYTPHAGNADCLDFELMPSDSMSMPSPAAGQAESVKDIVPILRHQTLYADQRRQLRLLSHRGDENAENQPLLYGVQSLDLQLEQAFSGEIYCLRGEVEFVGGKKRTFAFVHNIGRRAFYNFLLNRP